MSIEEVPLIQADITYGDIQREGILSHLARPSLLAITMLPQQPKNSTRSISRPPSPPIPPHPSIVQRRMELLTSDMLSRALTLVSKGQHERAHNLLRETRSIMQGLGKGGLPPVPPVPNMPGAPAATPKSPTIREPIPAFKKETTPPLANGVNGTDANGQAPLAPVLSAPNSPALQPASSTEADSTSSSPGPPAHNLPPSAPTPPAATADAQKTVVASAASFGLAAEAAGAVDPIISQSLDAELESALEWINHPAVFGRDSRKAVLQAIGVISCQHGYTFRTMMESLWASRIAGVRDMAKRSREWRESGMDESLAEEA